MSALKKTLLLTVFLYSIITSSVGLSLNTHSTKTMSNLNQTIELIHGSGEPEHAIIWLHGLGASSSDFPPVVPELGLKEDRPIRFIFPQAPSRPITVNGGMVMPGWYDIKGMDIADKQDEVGMDESKNTLDDLIEAQIQLGISSENIIIAGFSQGGAVAYHTGLRSKYKLAGILSLSTYIPFSEHVASEHNKVNLLTPILSMHGTLDPVVPVELGQAAVDLLSGLGYQIKWQTYPMQHQVVMQQINDIGDWINQVFE